jgi:transglutaminase-like putative cysteine protease
MTAMSTTRTARLGTQKPTAAMDLRMSGLLLLALGVALAGLHSLLMGVGWWFAAFGIALVVFGVSAIVRHYLSARWAGTAAGLLAAIVTITLFFGGSDAFLGFIPTGDTIARFQLLSTEAGASIASQSIPAFAILGIQFLVCWTIAAIAVVMDAVAIWWRTPALTGIPLLIVVAVPSFVQSQLSDPTFFEITAVVYLLIVRNRLRRVQPGVAIAVGAVAVLGALLAPAILPAVAPGTTAGGGSGLLAEGINPIINLGQDLRNSDPVPALTYTTTSSTGEYLRLATLDDFQGQQWAPSVSRNSAGHSVAKVGAPPGLTSGVASTKVTTDVKVANATGSWLPVPYPTTKVTGLTGTWYWEDGNLAIRSTDSSMQGETYSAKSLDVEPTVAQMRAAGSSADADSALAQVPKGLDPIVAATAKKVVGNAKTDFDKAVALQDWFRSGVFTYSTHTPVASGYDGTGLDVIVPFLKSKSGYCVHFATTMAVMARTLGIPSRVAVGFLPGKLDAPTSNSNVAKFSVSSADLHAWPELYFTGVGWVRFEPTPSKGFEPDFPTAPSVPSTDTPTDPSQAVPTSTPSAAPGQSSRLPDESTTKESLTTGSAVISSSGWGAFAVLLILLLLATPALIRVGIRRRRIDRIRQGTDAAALTWEELRESARDLGLDARDTMTPQELASYLATVLASVAAPAEAPLDDIRGREALQALDELRELVEDASYAPPTFTYYGDRMADALLVVLRELRRVAPRGQRARATLLPQTLVDRAFGRTLVRA